MFPCGPPPIAIMATASRLPIQPQLELILNDMSLVMASKNDDAVSKLVPFPIRIVKDVKPP